MIVTPGQLFRRADFYHQLGQLVTAGVPITNALQQISHRPPGFSYRKPLQQTLVELAQGKPFSQSLRDADWLPDFDLTLIDAGERSGRLDACFRTLANYYTERGNIARQIVSQMLYPAFLIHFAALVFYIVLPWARSQFNASILMLFAVVAVKILLPIYLVIAFIIVASQSKRGEGWRSFLERILHPVPVLGTARRSLALSRLSMALEALISAGVSVTEAWKFAAAASNSPALKRVVTTWKPQLESGLTPAELVNASRYFPTIFANLYQTGEVTGKLDETLQRMHVYFQEDSSHKIKLVVRAVCMAVYLAAVLLIAMKIIGFYTGYFHQVSNVINGF
ncbi:MAG TPA: type II secretion system F family protein [Verrucomicrobiae bacterium]|nr:type II secretion system F family protein [Verrucomicrobiae bacterium]